MKWMFDVQGRKEPAIKEDLVDCRACRVRRPLHRSESFTAQEKCCQFSPFLSCFALGAWLTEHPDYQPPAGQIFSLFGMFHDLQHRLTKGKLCDHYDRGSGLCSIWQQRPATCYTFFCASSHSEGLVFYEKLERQLMIQESQWVSQWSQVMKVNQKDWQDFVDYMDEKPASRELPMSLVFESWEEAKISYERSWTWLKSFILVKDTGPSSKPVLARQL